MTENSLKLSKEELIKNVIESHQHGESITQCVYKPLKEENTKYKRALDEIEGMVQTIMETNKIYPLQANLGKILDIISKAKVEEE